MPRWLFTSQGKKRNRSASQQTMVNGLRKINTCQQEPLKLGESVLKRAEFRYLQDRAMQQVIQGEEQLNGLKCTLSLGISFHTIKECMRKRAEFGLLLPPLMPHLHPCIGTDIRKGCSKNIDMPVIQKAERLESHTVCQRERKTA